MGLRLEVGCKNFRYAKLNEVLDDVTGAITYTVDKINKLQGLKTVVINTDAELKDVWGDDAVLEVLSSGLTKPTLEVGVLEVTDEFVADAFGYPIVNGVTRIKGNEIPNDIAIMFEVTTNSDAVIHYAFFKAKGNRGSVSFDGKEAGIADPKPKALTFNFMQRQDVGDYYAYANSDAEGFVLRDLELEVFGKSDIPAA